ncbi:hypothetical protein CGRA01v4_06953 [Colletotrichum graminicola]|uniref:Cas1p-like protein n=1 Tax=Colletotrichum graminicola (strain M1.001 / M2 / FGSC 10212) TaxID=645133 RepID=E3QR40_COLGM|nr:uncharacterized protein GLRG_08472 [Colletotrichum graminicola M1.001]EFQ33328.1 hypothetical protein GLRG_08472 [Colletotrichum graminicola M1.001]WDK15672.1 hypothetical protein CGRA01v4_06953 [Colletotrichum graminicola]
MHLKHIVAALVAFSSLAAAAPAQDSKAVVRRDDPKQNKDQGQAKNNNDNNSKNNDKNNNNKNNNNNNNRNENINIIQNIIRPNIIVVQENLAAIDQLQRQNEVALAALVQSQLALVTQLQTVKDNIRVNHFKALFPQANTVIVTVTNLVDSRKQGQKNQRYLVNQLLADNGVPGHQTLVMVTDPTPMQISTEQAASSQANAFGAANVQVEDAPAVGSINSSNQAVGGDPNAALNDKSINLAAFDQSAPFGQIGQSLILPAGTLAPQLASVPDPASIILPGQQGLFVQNAATFLSDCATSVAGGNQVLAGVAAQVFSSFQQIAAAQLAGLSGLGIYPANQGQKTPQAAPAPAQAQPAAAQPPAQAVTQPQASAPAAAPTSTSAAAAAPQAASGSGVIIVGSTPGGASAAQPQAAPAAAPAAASQPA